jgi:hypothetical protein
LTATGPVPLQSPKWTAPEADVVITLAPARRQRSTTAGRGCPQRLSWPAEAMAMAGRVAATNAGLDEVVLP